MIYDRYGESFPISDEALDSSFYLPIGKAKVCIPQQINILLKFAVNLLDLAHSFLMFTGHRSKEKEKISRSQLSPRWLAMLLRFVEITTLSL